MWIRLSIPRLQVDQLMGFAWKILIPLGLVNIAAPARPIILWVPALELGMAIFSWVFVLRLRGPVRPRCCKLAPAPAARGAAGGERLMLGMLKAMRTTLSHLPSKKITVQYPEEREHLPERSRGLFSVVIDPASGDPRCRACTLCETNCPVQVIRVNYPSKYALPAPNEARIARGAHRRAGGRGPHGACSRCSTSYYEHGTGLIAMLQDTQEVYGYLPRLALQEIALQTGVSLSPALRRGQLLQPVPPLAGGQVHHRRVPRHRLPRGRGRADHRGSGGGARHGGRQDDQGHKFTLSSVACMGACSLAPVMRIGDTRRTAV